jgi:hypothetical protein
MPDAGTSKARKVEQTIAIEIEGIEVDCGNALA